jgi:hypothetical protein
VEVYRPKYIYIYMYGFHKVLKCCVKYSTTMEQPSVRQRRIVASSEGGQGPEGALAPYMERNGIK